MFCSPNFEFGYPSYIIPNDPLPDYQSVSSLAQMETQRPVQKLPEAIFIDLKVIFLQDNVSPPGD